MEAVVHGWLLVVDGVLVLADDPAGAGGRPVLLPHDSEVIDVRPLVLRVLGRELRVGDHVDGGGGGVDPDSPLLPPDLPPALAGRHVEALQTLT